MVQEISSWNMRADQARAHASARVWAQPIPPHGAHIVAALMANKAQAIARPESAQFTGSTSAQTARQSEHRMQRHLCWPWLLIAVALATGCTTSPRPDGPTESVPVPLAESSLPPAEPLASESTEPPAPLPDPELTDGQARRDRALTALGVRYRYGGNTPETGFDCSGLIGWIYQDRADELPRSSLALSRVPAKDVAREQLQISDLLFFRINRARTISHVGMYMGDGQFIHAPSSGGRVRVESIDSPYWAARLVKARRLPVGSKHDARMQ